MKLDLKSLALPLGERWWIAVRTAPVCRERMPLEALLSYPLPDNGGIRLFHIMPPRAAHGQVRILSRIRATAPSVGIVEFRTAADGPLIGQLPNDFVGQAQKYDAAIDAALFGVLPQLVASYLRPDGRALARQYRDALESVAGPDLTPYYHSLNSDFFEWLQ